MKRKPSRAQAFAKAQELIGPCAEVTIVGPISRSWYRDQAQLAEILYWLSHDGIIPNVIGNSAFRHTAGEAAVASDAMIAYYDEGDPRETEGLDTVQLVIALPARNSMEIASAGKYVELALARGIPVLALWPDGVVTFKSADEAVE